MEPRRFPVDRLSGGEELILEGPPEGDGERWSSSSNGEGW
jgi:hypothetical protein